MVLAAFLFIQENTVLDIVLGLILVVAVILTGFGFYMLRRNQMVYEWRTRQLDIIFDDEELRSAPTIDDYVRIAALQCERWDAMPSYNVMMNKFWVWPLDKFLPCTYGNEIDGYTEACRVHTK